MAILAAMIVEARDSYMNRYIVEVAPGGLPARLSAHLDETALRLGRLPEERADHAYEPGKWTVRQLVAHILVSQRIFMTRALCFARGESQPLPGFDENVYAQNWPAETVSLAALAQAYAAEAAATRSWLGLLGPGDLDRVGVANNIRLRPEQILRALIGHETHHLRMLGERYGIAA
jgi:uncharacterized damage-inducible protein DinB